MQIIVENENDKRIIIELCDVALKSNGMANKNAVDYILQSIKEPEDDTAEKSDDKPVVDNSSGGDM